MIGVSNYSLANSNSIEPLDDVLDELEEDHDLDMSVFDNVELDQTLYDNVLAATKHEPLRAKTTFLVNPELQRLGRTKQKHTAFHEWVHGADFNNVLRPRLREEGLSKDVIDFLEKMLKSDDPRKVEGATEKIARILNPDSQKIGETFYPSEVREVEKQAEKEDIQLDIDPELESMLDLFYEQINHEVYEVESGENFYIETGEINGTPYRSVVFGEDADTYGPELTAGNLEQYLADQAGLDGSDYLDSIEDYTNQLEEEIDNYIFEYDEMPYGEGANYVGNVDQGHEVPLSASMGTPDNGR